MKAMILAAGEGTRMRPLTRHTPKPLLPVNGTPVIVRALEWFLRHGITEVGINLCYQGEQIRSYLGDGSAFGMKITYSPEQEPLGTAGGVKRLEAFFDGPFVVAYGDNVTDFNLSEMIETHCRKGAFVTIALFKSSASDEVGLVEADSDGWIRKFMEKEQATQAAGTRYASTAASGGVYVMERALLDCISPGGTPDFGYDVFPMLVDSGHPFYGYHLNPEDYFIDIGTPQKYIQADRDLRRREPVVTG